ncbi:O-antigen ligase family protein [Sporolactobacillus sp. STSJ-5]|uniref:O-antigen ligase family protein n=1 Tax=Sporolactobacillus sp. STSJ-5 TaxID=2965076 RepID=UPI002102F3E1|nr:O-antigen ligase family protein [Sporolactobacillus sp. STSJ-5]MCQ2009520.1 O-antigen ligase family protein [Sporolactobacillus sp. STSJ-5]
MFKVKYNICLIFLYIYLVLGNFPRIISIPGFENSDIAISEILFYIISIGYIAVSKIVFKAIKKNVVVVYILLFSFLFGVVKNGYSFVAFLYTMRILITFFSAYAIGELLFKQYGKDFKSVFIYFNNIYLSVLFISGIIFIAFPSSVDLWAFMNNFGVTINGDPHVDRLVSVYFDPNFYAAIACIPILINFFLYKETKKIRYLVYMALLASSIILTVSRSGLLTLAFVLCITYLWELIKLFTKMNTRSVLILVSTIFITLLMIPIFLNNLQRFILRFQGMSNDGSALERLDTFNYGIQLFKDNYLLGVGNGYIALYIKDYIARTSLDSSLLNLFISLGFILGMIVLGYFAYKTISLWIALSEKKELIILSKFYKSFVLYIIFCFIFTSQFNNLLYYQFWLIPVLIIFNYISIAAKK